MGSLPQRQYSERIFQKKKSLKTNPRETLYLMWVNDKIWSFCKDIEKALYGKIEFEDLFWGDKAKELTSIFQNFLNVKNKSNFCNFNKIEFGLSSVDKIIQLKSDLYYLITEKIHPDFVSGDDIFQDFFEEFITFTRRIFLKNEDYYENDIYDINDYSDDYYSYDDDYDDDDFIFSSDSESENENESESDSENDNESLSVSDSDSENESLSVSDSDSENESLSVSDSESN